MTSFQNSKWMSIVDEKQRIFRINGKQFDVLEYKKFPYTPDKLVKVSELIRLNLREKLNLKKHSKKYLNKYQSWKHPVFGYFKQATFALLYLMETDLLEPMRGDNSEGSYHWWIRDKLSGKKYDLTVDQFPDKNELERVYETGVVSEFYEHEKMPDTQLLNLIQKIQPDSKRWKANNYTDASMSTDEFLQGRAHESLY